MQELPQNKKIILFDGVCNLCNSAVQFIIKHDQGDVFRFVSLHSELGQEILAHIGIDAKNCDSIILYEPNVAYYYKSDAALQIAQRLNVFNILGYMLKIIPTELRNYLYDYVAKK